MLSVDLLHHGKLPSQANALLVLDTSQTMATGGIANVLHARSSPNCYMKHLDCVDFKCLS